MNGPPVGSVARAIALLDAVADSDGGARVGELARRIGVNPSTASRLLSTLEAGGLVERTLSGPYRLGLKLVALSDRVLGTARRARAGPSVADLAGAGDGRDRHPVGARVAGEAITVDFVPSPSSVVSLARLGRPSVAHATAAGKVMLAFGLAGALRSPSHGADGVHRCGPSPTRGALGAGAGAGPRGRAWPRRSASASPI